MVKEKLIELFGKALFEVGDGVVRFEDIAEILIANGVTVRDKGEWVWKLFPKADGAVERKAVCSLCGAPNKQYTPPYCPHCGAKMERGT